MSTNRKPSQGPVVRIKDVEFLKAPVDTLRSVLDEELDREVLALYPAIREKGKEVFGPEWAMKCLMTPWTALVTKKGSKTIILKGPKHDQKTILLKKEPLEFWFGPGLWIERPKVWKSLEWNEATDCEELIKRRMWEAHEPFHDEVQFVFRFLLDAPRRSIERSFRLWFKEFRRAFPAPKFGAPRKLGVLRYELAVLRIDREQKDVTKLWEKLGGYFPERKAGPSKAEVRKIRARMKRRIAIHKRRYVLLNGGN